MNANVGEVISVAQCAYIFLRVSKRPEFDVIYSRFDVIYSLSASEKYHRAGWKIADLPKDAKAVVCDACQKPGHTRQTFRGLKGFLSGKENQDSFQDI